MDECVIRFGISDINGDVIAPGARIEIPKDGVTLKHADGSVQNIPEDAVEIVTDDNGVILYMTLTMSPGARKFLEVNNLWGVG